MCSPRRRLALALCACLVGACQSAAAIGTACTRTADCAASLVCALGRCRSPCREARDCPIGARCIRIDSAPACTLDTENHCDTSVCPPPLACVASQCRNTCTSSADCVGGRCDGTTCAEPVSGADAGAAAEAGPDASTVAPIQQATGSVNGTTLSVPLHAASRTGSVLVAIVIVSSSSVSVATLTDDASNAWQRAAMVQPTNDHDEVEVWTTTAASPVSRVDATVTAIRDVAMNVSEWDPSASSTSVVGLASGRDQPAASSWSVSGTFTSNAIVFAATAYFGTDAATLAAPGFTSLADLSASSVQGRAAYGRFAAGTMPMATWSVGTATTWADLVVALRAP